MRIESFLGVIDSITGNNKVKLALDEWGLWHLGAGTPNHYEQPCTHRDALFAARYLHLLQRYPERIELATIAQSINVLHALLKTQGERMIQTPTYHVFDMLKHHQEGHVIEAVYSSPFMDFKESLDGRGILSERERLNAVTLSASIKHDTDVFITMTMQAWTAVIAISDLKDRNISSITDRRAYRRIPMRPTTLIIRAGTA